jgi:hypothetical protein
MFQILDIELPLVNFIAHLAQSSGNQILARRFLTAQRGNTDQVAQETNLLIKEVIHSMFNLTLEGCR